MNFTHFYSIADFIHYLSYETTRFVSPEAIAMEWVLVVLCALFVALAPLRLITAWNKVETFFVRLAERRWIAVMICAFLPVLFRLTLLGFLPVPEPSIHDEFSHLLLGDTLAHGRLANPAHPLWQHFESIHIIQQPTYSSMYPPGEGLFLAVGQVVFQEPWAGVVLSVALMCGAICWMMQGWMRASWAFYGTLLVILKIGVVGFWMNSYLSGAVAAIGGALLVGSLPRLRGEPRQLDAVLLALGLVILLNTRPFEGGVLGAASVIYLAPAILRNARTRQIVVPFAIVMAAGVCLTAVYCWKVTGHPFKLPYQVNRDAYGWPENLAFLPPKKVALRHVSMQNMYKREIAHRDIYKSIPVAVDNFMTRLFDNWTFLIGPLLTIPLLVLGPRLRNPQIRVLLIFLALIVGLNSLQMVLYPYHLGPVIPIIYSLVAYGCLFLFNALRKLSPLRARHFAAALPLGVILITTLKLEARDWGIPLAYWERGFESHRDARYDAERWLEKRAKKQLVVVRYEASHDPDQEWVYNQADIDGSKVVWAREMDCASMGRLLSYFSDREAWLLPADRYPQRLVPYESWSCTVPQTN